MSLKRRFQNDSSVFENQENLENVFENDFSNINMSGSESEAESENENGRELQEENEDDSDQWEDMDSEDEKEEDTVNEDDFENFDEDDDDDGDEEYSEIEDDEEYSYENKEDTNKEENENIVKKKSRRKVLKKNSESDSAYAGSLKEEKEEDNLSNKSSTSDKNTDYNEYEDDSSDEEDLRNTIGNIPINWYDEYEHLGYGLDSLPICKPKQGDTLDKFLDQLENPDYFRTVFDKQTGQRVRLSDAHLDLVKRILKGKVPNPNFNMYEPFQDLYSHEVREMPLSGRQEHKRSFLPVKSERQKVARLAYLIKHGLYKRARKPKREEQKYYDLWKPRGEDEPNIMTVTNHIPAPKVVLPGHDLSYNPPPEYLMTDWDEKKLRGKNVGNRKLLPHFSRKFRSVRDIPMYSKTLKERYERLLDLYLAPRKKYQKLVAESKHFLPKLPDKKDLRPYPTLEGLVFKGHRSIVRTISIHPNGKYLASGSDDHTVKVWEINNGRCLRTFEVEEVVKKVMWNPNPKLFLLGIAMGNTVVFLNPETYLTDKVVVQQTNSIFKEEVDQGDYLVPERIRAAVTWRKPTVDEWQKGYRIVLDHFKEVKEIVWHRQGDYFATVIPEGIHRSVLIHQLSRWRSQLPFQKNKGRVQTVAFHPKEPLFFVVTQSHIRVYNLKKQGLMKKILANSRWVSCIAIHPGGENFVIGTYDRRVNWFEMECTKRPHLMRFHGRAVRSVGFHRKYPLFATCSDDRKLVVCHGTVYDDLLKDPLIVPLKQLRGHKLFDDLYVLDVVWHPHEPYLFSAGADATIRLWH